MITQLDAAGLLLIKHFEGVVLHPYRDQVGIPTIGIGMTYYPGGKPVSMDDQPITMEQADQDFILVSHPYAHIVSFATKPVLTQNQFNGLFCFCYNIGISGFKGSTVLRLVNQSIFDQRLKDAFLMWDKADGQLLEDLVDRREMEYNTFIS